MYDAIFDEMAPRTAQAACVVTTVALAFLSPISLFAAQNYDYNYGPERASASEQPKMNVDSFDGSLVYEYPMKLPPGRNGMEPSLSLTYSSKNTDNTSPFGYGWSVNTPYIERVNESGLNTMYATTTSFFSSFDGELQATSSATTTEFGALNDAGDFRKYEYINQSYWRVTDKKGVQYTFGTTSLSQLADTASSTRVARWMLEETRDRNGNYVKYEYQKSDGQLYPYKIKYTGNGSTDGIYEIEFLRETRPDIATSSRTGFSVISKQRVSEIAIRESGNFLKSYKLGYGTGDNGYRSMLTALVEAGRSEAGATTTAATTTLSYATPAEGWTLNTSWVMPTYFLDDTGTTPSVGDVGIRFDDFNGDGLVDIARARITDPYIVYLNKGDGTWTSTTPPGMNAFVAANAESQDARVADINGDGLADIVVGNASSTLNTNRGSSFATSTDWFTDIKFIFATTSNIKYDNGGRIVDLNGDGLPDLAKAFASTTAEHGIYFNNGAGWDATSSSTNPLTHDLASWWAFDNNASDSHTHGNNLTTSGSPVYASGKQSNAIDFEHDNSQYASISDASQTGLDITGDLSIALWVNFETFDSNNQRLVGKWNSGGVPQAGYGLRANSGSGLCVDLSSDGSTVSSYCTSWSPSTGTWYQIGVTFDAANRELRFYVNGAQQGSTQVTTETSLYNNTAKFGIGTIENDTYIDGKVDEVGVWSRELPATDMTLLYASGSGKSYSSLATSSIDWFLPSGRYFAGYTASSSQDGIDFGERFADFNGDGLTDILYSRKNGSPPHTYIDFNNGDGSWTESTLAGDLASTTAFVENDGKDTEGWRIVDVNADGLPDIVHTRGSSGNTVYKNVDGGRTFIRDSSWGEIPDDFVCEGFGCDAGDDVGSRFLDINGDGIIDIVRADGANSHSGSPINKTYLGNATTPADLLTSISSNTVGSTTIGYRSSAKYTDTSGNLLNPRLPVNFQTVETVTRDSGISGRAIGTTTYSYGGGEYYYAGPFDRKFAGFATTTVTDPAGNITKTFSYQGNGSQSAIGEFNDARSKIGKPYRMEMYSSTSTLMKKTFTKWENTSLGNGRAFVLKTQDLEMQYDGNSDHKDTGTTYAYDSDTGNLLTTTEYGDVRGSDDGTFDAGAAAQNTYSIDFEDDTDQHASISDAAQTGLDITGSLTIALWVKFESLGIGLNRLVSKWNSAGVSEAGYHVRANTSTNQLCADLSGNGSTVNTYCVSWTPSAGTWYHLGFVFDASVSQLKFYVNGSQQGSTQSTSETSLYNNTAPFCVSALQTNCNDTNGHDGLMDELGVWSRALSGTDISSLYNSGSGLRYADMTSGMKTNLQGYWDFNNSYTDLSGNGNTLTGSGSPTFSTTVPFYSYAETPFVRKTSYTYAASTTTHVLSLPQTETVLDSSSATTSQRQFYYDSLALGSVDKGNLTKDSRLASSTAYLDTQYAYNSYGLVTTATDPRGKQTTYSYNNNLFVATTTNPAGHVTESYYDLSSGAVKKRVDPNGFAWETVYDGLDRPIEEKVPDHLNNPASTVTAKTYEYTDTLWAPSIKETGYLNPATTTEKYTYFDGLGRKVQERAEMESAYVVKDWEYDARGLLNKESLPYMSAGTARTDPTVTTNLLVSYGYDALGRLASTTNVKGTASTTYDQWTETTQDRDGKVKRFVYDAFKRLTNVGELTASTTATTTYAYDVLNNLSTTTDAYGNIRQFTYDGLSRLLSATDLHAANDTNYGTRLYGYDAAGNIASTTNPNGNLVQFTYDDINRPLTENYTGASGTEVQYAYDTCTNGKGRLCTATTTEAVTSLAYDALGNAATSTRVINAATSTMAFVYDRQKNLAKVTYPNNLQANYVYNSAGQLNQLWVQTGTTTNSILYIATSTSYGPNGMATQRMLGNGLTTYDTFDSDALYRLTNIQTFPSNSVSGTSSPLLSNLSAWWTFNNNANDSTTNGNNLTTSGGPSYTTGKQGNAIDFELDNSQYASISDASQTNLDVTGSFSMSMWVKPESVGSIARLAGKFNSAGVAQAGYHFRMGTGGTGLCADLSSNGSSINSYCVSWTPSASTWYLVGVTFDASAQELKFYVNGTQQGATQSTTESSIYDNTASWCTASLQNCTDSFNFDGLMDEHAVWKGRVLSSSDMSSLYNSGSGVSYASLATSTTATSSANVQNSSYTYDAVGNILSIADNAIGGTGVATTFVYDDYHRLVSASTTAASSTPFLRTYSYDSLGNLTYKSDIGSYAYSTTTYANPHAATSIGGVSYSYDNNGNLVQVGTGVGKVAYSWDWRDRLTQTASSTATSTFSYDENNQRIRKTTNLSGVFATTTYPSRYFNYSSSGTTTAHILLPDGSPIATVEANGVATSTYWLHVDHLGGVQVVTNASGTAISVSDSYPYGNPRIASSSTSYREQRGYIGENYDSDSSMSYLNARYYKNTQGQFLSQDPVFLGMPKDQNIRDPQSLNAYSYANDNPIVNKDPSGKFWWKEFYTDWSGYSGWSGVGMKVGEVLGGRFAAQDAIAANSGNIAASAAQTGVSPSVYQAIMYEENSHQFPPFGGERALENLSPDSFGGGVGVMQVSAGASGLGNRMLINDKINVYAAGGILKGIQSKYGGSPSTMGAYYNSAPYGPGNNHANLYGQRINSYANTSLNPTLGDKIVRGGVGGITASTANILSAISATLSAISSILSSMSK